MNLNRYAAQQLAQLSKPVYPGLPVVRSAATRRSPQIGATVTMPTREASAPVEVANLPSIKLVPLPEGGVTVRIELRSRYAAQMTDLGELHNVAQSIVDRMKAQSQGPFTAKMLRRAGHPYGRDKGVARRVPRGMAGRSLGHVKGVRGSMPPLSIINRQSGIMADSWEYALRKTPTGAVIEITNAVPYAVYLAMGTRFMQAHGPWTDAPVRFQSQVRSAWQKEVRTARGIALNQALAAQSLGI